MKGLAKYTIPIIGVLSSGKSTFINGLLLNKTILEVGMSHTTKFICIIRYKNSLANGKYRFTKVKLDSNSGLIKDGDTLEDENEIKNKIKELNTKEVVSEYIINNIYLLESNIHLIDDEKENYELLKDIDFMDIPGLDFFESKKESKDEIESKKILNIFKNFKNRLKYFIIVFDCLRLHHDTAFTILEKLKTEFNLQIENNLIIINKINLMPEKNVNEIKEYFIQELLKKPDVINHNKNILLPLNAEKILLQQQYKKDFYSFIKYFYYLFCEDTLKKGYKDENYFMNFIMNFIDKKKEELKIESIDISKIDNYLKEIKPALEQIYTNNYHSEQTKNIEEESKEDFFNDLNIDFFCELYYLYSNNLIEYDLAEYKEAKQEIFNYLKKIKKIKENQQKEKEDIIKEKNDNLLFIKKLDEFLNLNLLNQTESTSGKNPDNKLNREFHNILREINQRKNLIVNAFLNTQFRISVVGLSSAGKSYIVNCLIGQKILETGSGETTQFGLIIENHDSDEVSLSRAKYKYIEDENGKEYLIFEKDNDSFVSGFDKVKETLLLLNKNKIHQEKDISQDKNELFRFWILKIRINMCQFKNFNVQIIDFPGLGTSMKYNETEIFKNLLSTSNIIFHVIDFYRMGEADREINDSINICVNDFRMDPNFARKNTLYLLNKLNPLKDNDTKYEDKISEIFGYKKDIIDIIEINNKFYDDVIEVTNFTFSNYIKKNYDKYKQRYKNRYSDFISFFNAFNKIKENEEKSLDVEAYNQIAKDKAIEEFNDFLSKDDMDEYETIIYDDINENEKFKNNILYCYIKEKIKLDKNGTLAKIDKINNFIIEKFGNNREYFKKIIKAFTEDINKLLANILNSRSIPKEELDKIKDEFKAEIILNYEKLYKLYSNNFAELTDTVKDKFNELKKKSYKNFSAIDKSKIREDIQIFIEQIINNYNKRNKEYFNVIIQNELYKSLTNIILNYEQRKNINKKQTKIEFSEFKEFIKNNIDIIQNENIDLENVETEKDECCGYSEEKKNAYLKKKCEDEIKKLDKYFKILIGNCEKQKIKYINNYSVKLSTYFGEYNREEKKNIITIKQVLNNIINEMFKGISDYHSYVAKSYENSTLLYNKQVEKIKNEKKLNKRKKINTEKNKKEKTKIEKKETEKPKIENKEIEMSEIKAKDNIKAEAKENIKIEDKENIKIEDKENIKIEAKETEKEKIENKQNEKANIENKQIESKESDNDEKEMIEIDNKEIEKIEKLKDEYTYQYQNISTDTDEGFGFKKMDIFIYPGNDPNLKGISIKIYKEFCPELSTPFISIAFPQKNINLFEKLNSYLIDFENKRKEKIFVISKEKSLEKIMMKINFIKNFKYYNWIDMFTKVFEKFSLFKFEFLTPIMLDQPMDNRAFYDILKSFLLIQIQGEIPIRTIFEFLKVENIVNLLLNQLIPDYMRVLINAFTSITFELNTSIEEIPYKDFIEKGINQGSSLNITFFKLIQAFLGIPDAFIDSEDVEINFRLFRNNLKILLNLPAQNKNL